MTGYYGTGIYGLDSYGPGLSTVVTLDRLKRHLRVTNTTTDEHLQDVLDVATDLAEQYSGRTWAAQVVREVHDGGRRALLLRNTPVQAIESVIEDGVVLAAGDYTADLVSGLLYRGAPTSGTCWASGAQIVVVNLTAGPTVVPATVQQAVLELARHLWDPQRGGSQLPRQAGAGDDWDPRDGFAIPHRVAELLDHHRAPGFA